MKNWTDVFGTGIPDEVEIVNKVMAEFPLSETLIVYMEDKETLRIQKNFYQDEGFLLPVGDWGDFEYSKEKKKGRKLRYFEVPDTYCEAVMMELHYRGIKTNRGMARNPADGIVYNPYAVRDINSVLAYEIGRFMRENGVSDYKVSPLEETFGVQFKPRNKYVSATPSSALMADIKSHFETEYNILMGQIRASGDVHIDVLDYACEDTTETLRAAFEDPANHEISVLPKREGDDRDYHCFDTYVMARGKMTMFRHGYVAGMSFAGSPDRREKRYLTKDGAGFLVEGSSICGAMHRARYEYKNARERAKLGALDFSQIYSEAWPDYIAEELINEVKAAHDREKSISEREAFYENTGVVEKKPAMPVAVENLKAGDFFGAFNGGWYWCEVQNVTDTEIEAWVINGAYKLPFDRQTGLVKPAYGVFDSKMPIVFTAELPFKQHASYNEAIEYMAQQTGYGGLQAA